MSAAGLPVCAALAYVAVAKIGALCVVCSAVYAVTLAIFILSIATHRGRFGELLRGAPAEWAGLLRERPIALTVPVLVVVLGAAQWAVVPRLLPHPAPPPAVVKPVPAPAPPHDAGPPPWQVLPVDGRSLGPGTRRSESRNSPISSARSAKRRTAFSWISS
ncbi:MAG: vitamin K epoxide reductase family protein [Deltaproteobacteria bacterium]|nr:vitamin K epoxide reductase family protein [Deltaproteobacteria bacterium]